MPKKYFDLYDPKTVSLAPNRLVPTGFKEENFHADGTFELVGLNGTVSVIGFCYWFLKLVFLNT